MEKRTILVSMLVVGAMSLLAAAEMTEPLDDDLARMESENIVERQEGAEGILRQRQQTVRQVEQIARRFLLHENRKGTAKTAIVLLGKLRSVESVPFLAQNLTFEVFHKETGRPQPPEDLYPCVGALTEIGIPSLDAVVEKAAATDTEKTLRCAAHVIRGVLGDLAADYIEHSRGRTAEGLPRARLGRLLAIVEELESR